MCVCVWSSQSSQAWVNEVAAAAKQTCNGLFLIKLLCHKSGDMLSALTVTPPPTTAHAWITDTWTEVALDALPGHTDFQRTEKNKEVKNMPDKLVGIQWQQHQCSFLSWLAAVQNW